MILHIGSFARLHGKIWSFAHRRPKQSKYSPWLWKSGRMVAMIFGRPPSSLVKVFPKKLHAVSAGLVDLIIKICMCKAFDNKQFPRLLRLCYSILAVPLRRRLCARDHQQAALG